MSKPAISPELQARITLWRQRAADGTLTVEEMKEAIEALRNGRISAAHASEGARRTKAKAAIPSAEFLLQQMQLPTLDHQ